MDEYGAFEFEQDTLTGCASFLTTKIIMALAQWKQLKSEPKTENDSKVQKFESDIFHYGKILRELDYLRTRKSIRRY